MDSGFQQWTIEGGRPGVHCWNQRFEGRREKASAYYADLSFAKQPMNEIKSCLALAIAHAILLNNMIRIIIAFLLVFLPIVSHAQNISAIMRQDAEKCAKAVFSGDYEQVCTYTHKRIIEASGGKKKMVPIIKRAMEEMKSKGVEFENATMGDPQKPIKVAGWLVALIPQHIIMKAPGGHIEQDSYLLGISEDDGKKWVFVDVSSLTTEELAKFFPELTGKINIPERKKPVFKKD